MSTWTAVSVAVAVVYAFVWPRPKPGAARSPLRQLVLRWGHTLVWIILAVSFWIRGRPAGRGAADLLALAAAVSYAVFLGTFLRDRAAAAKRARPARRPD